MKIYQMMSMTDTGAQSSVPTTEIVAATWLKLHEELPDDLASWSNERLSAECADTPRFLLLLGHHKSSFAVEVLTLLRAEELSEEEESLAELALAEALGWIGYSYVRAPDQVDPEITPVPDDSVASC